MCLPQPKRRGLVMPDGGIHQNAPSGRLQSQHLDDADVFRADIDLDVAFSVPVCGTADACIDSPAVDGQPLVPAGEYRSPAKLWARLVGEARLGRADVMDGDLVLEDWDVLEADPPDVFG